jgi:S1-C subfamily serine protease
VTAPRPAPRRSSGLSWLALLLAAMALIAVWPTAARFWSSLRHPPASPRPITPRGDLAADERATVELFQEISPSVVYITSLTRRRDFFSLNVLEIPQGTGSGFVWDDRGHVVTNFHVIETAQAARITLSDHSAWDGRLVGYEADKDLAVLQIDAPREGLRPIPVGTSHDLKVGQKVFAIGNPFGLDQTLTTGIISALDREIRSVTGRPIQGVIQTDAVINPGNSGGPLLDSAGRLIGVNTAIYSAGGSGTYIGIGFAVPVDTVNRVVPQIIQHGRAVRVGLGVHLASDTVTRRLGIQGALVLDVDPGSGAAEAGIRGTTRDAFGDLVLGDVIVAIDGEEVSSADDVSALLEGYEAGRSVGVTVIREGRRQAVSVKVQSIG